MAGFGIVALSLLIVLPAVILVTLFHVFLLILLTTILLYFIYNYVISGLSLHWILKKKGTIHPKIAFIPGYASIVYSKYIKLTNIGIAIFCLELLCLNYFLFLFIYPGLYLLIISMLIFSYFASVILDILLCHKILNKIYPTFSYVLLFLNIISLGLLKPVLLYIYKDKILNEIVLNK